MKHRYECKGDHNGSDNFDVRVGCAGCRDVEAKESSYCRCGQVVSNAAFFKKTSAHFNGKCRRWGAPLGKLRIPERTVDKKLPYPMPALYTNEFLIAGEHYVRSQIDLEKFCAYWGIKPIGDGLEAPPVITMAQNWQAFGEGRWIKALFSGNKCVCGVEVKKDDKAYWYKDTRKILCETCGKRAVKVRYAKAA